MTVDFHLPEFLKSFAESQASLRGFTNVEEFMRSLATEALQKLEQDVAEEKLEDYGAPEEVTFRSKAELEKKLLEAVASIDRGEIVDVPPDYFKKLKEDYAKKHNLPSK